MWLLIGPFDGEVGRETSFQSVYIYIIAQNILIPVPCQKLNC